MSPGEAGRTFENEDEFLTCFSLGLKQSMPPPRFNSSLTGSDYRQMLQLLQHTLDDLAGLPHFCKQVGNRKTIA